MSLTTQVSDDGSTVTIGISGRFDFGIHREFRNAYEKAETKSPDPKYVVDLAGTEYMDSSALGMLLLLREHAGGDRSDVTIVNCRPVIREILDIANFDKLFTLKSAE
jgi:anti-anti-sigma factor